MQKKRVVTTIIVTVILLLYAVNADATNGCNRSDIECGSVPTDNCDVTHDTTFTPGTYALPNGIDICSSSITLDCNNATLLGPGSIATGHDSFFGILLNGTLSATIQHCQITQYYHGVYLSSSNDNIIHGNTVYANKHATLRNGRGIFLDNARLNRVINNDVRLNNEGISLIESHDNRVVENVVEEQDLGLVIKDSDRNTFIGNQIHLNADGIHLDFSESNNLNRNSIRYNIWGVALYNAHLNTLESNVMNKNKEFGLYLTSSLRNTIHNNSIQNNDFTGMHLSTSAYNTLSFNELGGNLYNLGVDSPTDGEGYINAIDTSNTIDDRPIYYILNADGATYDDTLRPGFFACIRCTNITVKNLQLKANAQGMLFYDVKQSLITNNTITKNLHGISLIQSTENTFSENTLVANSNAGVQIINANTNLFYRNNFVETAFFPVFSSNSINTWYFHQDGNFWSDYNTRQERCHDLDRNGRCDDAYTITRLQEDKNPFLKRNGWSCHVYNSTLSNTCERE